MYNTQPQKHKFQAWFGQKKEADNSRSKLVN